MSNRFFIISLIVIGILTLLGCLLIPLFLIGMVGYKEVRF